MSSLLLVQSVTVSTDHTGFFLGNLDEQFTFVVVFNMTNEFVRIDCSYDVHYCEYVVTSLNNFILL